MHQHACDGRALPFFGECRAVCIGAKRDCGTGARLQGEVFHPHCPKKLLDEVGLTQHDLVFTHLGDLHAKKSKDLVVNVLLGEATPQSLQVGDGGIDLLVVRVKEQSVVNPGHSNDATANAQTWVIV